jgi:O-antigen ligase
LEARGGGWHAAHNIWVETAAETGIVGLVLLAIALATAIVPAAARGDFRAGFHIVLFLVLMTASLAANLVTSKGFWIGLAILSVTAVVREGRPVSAAPHGEVGERFSVLGSG